MTEDAAEQEQHLTGEIASWNEYLDWKRQLAELRIRGLKYIGYKFDVENRELIFLTVAEGKENFDEFRNIYDGMRYRLFQTIILMIDGVLSLTEIIRMVRIMMMVSL